MAARASSALLGFARMELSELTTGVGMAEIHAGALVPVSREFSKPLGSV